MCRKRCGRHKRRPTRTTIQHENGEGTQKAHNGTQEAQNSRFYVLFVFLPFSFLGIPEYGREFLWRNDLKLRVCAIARLLVRAPSSKMRDMAEAITLHVIVF